MYTDPVVQGHSMLTIRKHLEDVTALTQHICLLMREATPSQEEDVSALMKELRKKQGSLKKAIDRKNDDIDQIISVEVQSTPEPEMLLQEDIDEIVQIIKTEEQER